VKTSLTDNQRIFCEEYSVDRNGTRAYLAAYRNVKKEKTAAASANRLLGNDNIRDYIRELLDAISKRTAITADRVLLEYGKLAFVNPKSFFNDDGTPRNISELDDDTAAAIAGLEVKVLKDKYGYSVGSLYKIKITDKKGSLDSIGKHLGMFTNRMELSGPNGGAIQTKADIVQELFDSVDGATKGIPKPRLNNE